MVSKNSRAVERSGDSPIDYALQYLRAGLSVVPIRGDGSKAAAVAWKRLTQERATESDVRGWWLADNVGVAVAHGPASGNSEVVDLDDVSLMGEFFGEIEARCPGLLERLTIVRTPRPGYHLIYRCSMVEGNKVLARGPDGNALIETRGAGGYALAPGSPGCCHPTGREYEHASGPPLTDLPTITAVERAAIFAAARVFDEKPPEPRENPVGVINGTHDGVSPGDGYNARATWCEILTPHGWRENFTRGDVTHWTRPGKEEGTSATTGLRSKGGTELIYIFSTSATPFEANCGYSKFAAFTLLNHDGDFAAAARALASQGYGDRRGAATTTAGLAAATPQFITPPLPPIETLTFRQLAAGNPRLAEPVVEGLFRAGETVNVIAPPKAGKSWLVYGLALSIINGRDWLETFPTRRGKVLLVDNELHRATLANRVPAVAEKMGLLAADYIDDLHVWPLRGNLRSLVELRREFEAIPHGEYQAIILDAKYRFAIEGQSENDNSAETLIYNRLDGYAASTGAAFVLIHHASKGGQGGKAVTDVGAGAGAQSRAADAHLVLREHEEPGVVVLEAAVRSFQPVDPLPLRFEFPLWLPAGGVDPGKLKGRLSVKELRQAADDREGFALIAEALQAGPASTRQVRDVTGLSKDRADRLLSLLVAGRQVDVETETVRGNVCRIYTLKDRD
ncbi:MAG: AAA family ATPase [Pirellulales bacterium]|nr:AAA family ATPase [Pirellulales bacterium]